jgi:hypothetical protein
MYRNRELIVGESSGEQLKNLVNTENVKKFFPKRASLTANIALRFLDKYLRKPKEVALEYKSSMADLFIEEQNSINEQAMAYFESEISHYQ